MPTLEIKFAIAILIAVFRFGAAHFEITMEVTHSERGKIANWVLMKEERGFSIVHEENGQWFRTGFVTTFSESPAKLQFAEEGMAPSVNLDKIIKNFDELDFERGESRLEAEIDGEKAEFQMICDAEEISLFHEESKLTFKLRGK